MCEGPSFTHFSDTAIWCCPGSGLFVMRSSRTPRSKLASCWEILEKVRFSENWYSFQTASEAPEVGSCFRPDPRNGWFHFWSGSKQFQTFQILPTTQVELVFMERINLDPLADRGTHVICRVPGLIGHWGPATK